tara:strand:- start:454 stop:765 length:312 start_codon:yes stop_codon:yes gene_type:complete
MAKICPRCRGNGYIKVKESIENQTETISQCPLCNSQGEIMSDIKPSKETERLILESVLVKKLNGVIKKQNDEIDMLLKQKQFLQSKLREATGGKNQTSSKQGD